MSGRLGVGAALFLSTAMARPDRGRTMKTASIATTGLAIALAGALAGCASTQAAYNPPPRADDDTRLVSCQLPPQIRRLGQHTTYHAAGRVVQTHAADCRLRGGQIRELATAPPGPSVTTDGTMAVIVGGDAATAACPVDGTITGLRSGSTLNVRSGPGTGFPSRDALVNGRRVFVCDGSADSEWLGVVYPTAGGQECGVAAPRGQGGAYVGPCRSGWVNAGWVATQPR